MSKPAHLQAVIDQAKANLSHAERSLESAKEDVAYWEQHVRWAKEWLEKLEDR